MVKCLNCGKENIAGAKFCENCGYDLTVSSRSQLQSMQKKRHYWPWITVGTIVVFSMGIFIFMKLPNADSSAEVADSTSSLSSSKSPTSSSSKSFKNESSTVSASKSVDLTEAQQSEVENQMLSWADSRAKIGNMAVSDFYFDHGAAGAGDWYANSTDGEIQVQNEENPGKSGFKIHAVGGLVFYTAKDGTTGVDNNLRGTTADGYSLNMDFSKPVSKYLFGDNGIVYELKLGNGTELGQNTGFGEYSDDGTNGRDDLKPNGTFLVSNDQAAKGELQQVLAQY